MGFDHDHLHLSLAALLVASLSAFWSFRNHFGWAPYVMGKNFWLTKGLGGKSALENLVVEFEIWNRRKYPISVRGIKIKFDQLILKGVEDHPEWVRVGANRFDCRTDISFGPSEHQTHTIALTLDNPERNFTAGYGIWIECFDPRLERTIEVYGKGSVHIPNANKIDWA